LQLINSLSSTQYGQSVQFTVTAPTPAIGALRSVQLWADARLLAAVELVNGEASFTINTLTSEATPWRRDMFGTIITTLHL